MPPLKNKEKLPSKSRPVPKSAAKPASSGAQTDPAVDAFMRTLDHPQRAEIEAARRTILAANPKIREGIKWNAPSFQTTVFFATVNLRVRNGVQLIFHKGAKKEKTPRPMTIADPARLLKWLAPDRAMVALGSGKAFRGNQAAFKALVRAWIGQL
jgi:hypothetical protein